MTRQHQPLAPQPRCGDIGEGQREWEFEPLEQPTTAPVEEPAPAAPAPTPERQPEREPVPA